MTPQVLQHVSLHALNTLALPSEARYYIQIKQREMLEPALQFAVQQQLQVVILSGGSNVLLPEKLNAVVLHIDLQGIDKVKEDEQHIWLKVAAGQVWHDFVLYTTEQGYYGLQNLALIPGRVGAAPVQNIGAYGVEVGEFIETVDVYDRDKKRFCHLTAEECQFAYRHSIFKQNPQRFIIIAVTFKLHRVAQLRVNYGDLKQAMAEDLSPQNLQQQVITIRKQKLPDPQQFANVGSFFKNPVISYAQYEQLKHQYPTLVSYPQGEGHVKIAAGWLIEHAGWKGKRLGQVGMFERQALVLVNYGQATLHDVQQTYQAVQHDVYQKFAIMLEPEPVLFDEQGSICRDSLAMNV